MTMKNRTYVLLTILLLSVMMVTGCASQTQTISTYEMKENAENADRDAARLNKETLKASFDRQYADELYLEDLDEVKNEVYQVYQEHLENQITENFEFPSFMRTEVEFYNDSLKRIKDNELTVEEAIKNPEEHIRSLDSILYVFATNEERPDERMLDLDKKLQEINNFFKENSVKHKIAWRIYDSKILEKLPLDEIEEMEEPLIYLERNNLILDETFYTDDFTSKYEHHSEPYYVNQLEEKENLFNSFKIEFVGVGQDGFLNEMYAPINNLSLKVQQISNANRFITIMAQKLLSDQIYEIIESEDASDFIGALVVPNDSGNTSMDYAVYDFSQPIDELTFLNEKYEYKYDVSLINLSSTEESIDYEKLMRISNRIWNLLDEKDNRSRIVLFIDFYIVESDEEKELITSLLYENRLSEQYIVYEDGLSHIYKNMYKRRIENEAFFYLDLYVKKLDEFMMILNNIYLDDVEKFVEIYTTNSEF